MDSKQIEILFAEHMPKVYHFFFFKLYDVQTAEDLTSDTFVRLAKLACENEIKNPKALLYGITQRVWLEFLRVKYQKNEVVLSPDEFHNQVDRVMQITAINSPDEDLMALFNTLPKQQRDVLVLRYIENITIKQAAATLGKDDNYIKVTQKRALHNLRQKLSKKKGDLR